MLYDGLGIAVNKQKYSVYFKLSNCKFAQKIFESLALVFGHDHYKMVFAVMHWSKNPFQKEESSKVLQLNAVVFF